MATRHPIDTANGIGNSDDGLWLLSDQAVQMAFDSGILDTDNETDVIEESHQDLPIEHIDHDSERNPPSPINILFPSVYALDSEAAKSRSYSSSVASVIDRLKVRLAKENMEMESGNRREHRSSISYSKTMILESPPLTLSIYSIDPTSDEIQRPVAYQPSTAILQRRLKYSIAPHWLASREAIKGENLLNTTLMEGAQVFCDIDIDHSQAREHAIIAFANARVWCSTGDQDRFTAICNCHWGDKGKRKAIAQHLINLRSRFKAVWKNGHADSQCTDRKASQQKYLLLVVKYCLSKARVKTRGHLFLLSFLAAVFLLIPPHRKKQIEAVVALMTQCTQA